MIKVKKTDNIFDVIYKIEKSKNIKKILLEIPFGHSILHNYLALKSLKNRFPNKKIIITTTDIASKKIGKPLGIKYSIIKNDSFIEKKTDIMKYNYSFFEYFKYETKRYFKKVVNILLKNKKIIKTKAYYKKYNKQKSNITLFLSLLTVTVLIFLYIFYFTLNKTYIYITPAIKVQTKSKNFVFKEVLSGSTLKTDAEKLLKIEKEISIEKEFNTTGLKQGEKYRASGEVEFINNFPEQIKLKPKTRLLSGLGILYETNSWISVPGAIKNKAGKLIPGITKAKIRAKLKDKNGIFIGERGNLSKTGAILTIPGLKGTNIDLYAKTISPLNGGKNSYTKIVGDKDKQNAEKIIIEELKKQAINQILEEIKIQNETNNVVFKKLSGKNMYKFSDIKVKFYQDLIPGKKLEKFKVKGSIKAYSFAYNTDSVISKLKKEIENSIIEEKEKILFINDESIRIANVLYRNEKPFYIKATMVIEVFLAYNFENEDDNYIQRLKQTIAGLDKKEAEKILINESKISNVKIEIRPFFLKNISSFFDNIKFVIE